MDLQEIKSAREYHKSQKWDDSPIDLAIDILLAEVEKLQLINKTYYDMLSQVVHPGILEAITKSLSE